MRRFHFLGWAALSVVGLLWGAAVVQAQSVSMSSLLDEMVDRDNLARFPEPAYTCSQASSYDRGSVAPDKPGWFANSDRSFFVRREENEGRTENVMMDVDGPGAIVRIWATWHGPRAADGNGLDPFSNGTFRVYLDGSPEPAIEGPIASIIDGGGLLHGPLSEGVSPETEYGRRGHNLYLPIPYAKHCKVTYETSVLIDDGGRKGEALYYQINYRTYDEGTAVKPFQMQQLAKLQDKLDTVQQRLTNAAVDVGSGGKPVSFSGPLAAGKTRTLVVDQPGAIRRLTLNLEADNQPQALRSTILELEFDGKRTVWCPVGAFFGRGYQSDPHRTWYTDVTDDGTMSSFWVMPYERTCKISLINLSDAPVNVVKGEASLGTWQWDHRSMHFYGSWRQLTGIDSWREGAENAFGGAQDVNYVEVDGKGVYVGDTLTIFNGTAAWWGEGDEKIFVDGETFPSHLGTGTEDYYGYAWCRPEYFQSPFHAQPTGAGNLRPGFSVNSRYRALDAIPFTKSIKFDMELWHWRNTTVNFAPAAFWYAQSGSTNNAQPDPKTAALPVSIAESPNVKGALEGEGLVIIEKTGGKTEKQQGSFGWSQDTQLWWIDGKPGDKIVLEFPVKQAGTYQVSAGLTKAIDYGIVKLAVNDSDAVEFDRFNDGVAFDRLDLGTMALPQGKNRLTVTIVGANEEAVKRHMFGLDYLLLTPAGS